MKKQNTVKHSLFMSVIALLLCFSMLLGTTFAWFTDNVTSSNNIIKSGTLDVEMYYADGTEDPASVAWLDASQNAIFNYDKWEPGYAEVKHIKIANVGTLAFKYQLQIVANGAVSKLADVIDVYFVDPAVQVANRSNLSDGNKIGTLTDVLAGMPDTANGQLLAGNNATITIALKMQESAGNEYQDLAIGTDFAVKLFATQLTSEEDSFDDQYDAQSALPWTGGIDTAWYDNSANDFAISSPDQLAGLAKLANEGETFTGKTISLSGDMNLNNVDWTPIGNDDYAFNGTLDGNGHTITGLTVSNAGDAALFNTLDADATVKNVNFADVNINAKNAGVVAVYIAGSTVENVHILSGSVNGTSYAAAFAGQQAWSGATFKNCTNKADVTAGFIAAGFGGYIWYDSVVEDCVNYGDVTGGNRAGGIAAHFGGTIKKCTNNGEIISKGAMGAGGVVAVLSSASTFENCVNNGDVTNNGTDASNSLAGGILGVTPGSAVTVKNCVNNGKIVANNSYASGIATSHYGSLTAINCENNGDVYGATGSDGSGSATSMFGGNNTITDCVNNGTVTKA